MNDYSINSPLSDREAWEQAWDDNNNNYKPPSYQPQQREIFFDKTNKHSFDFKHSQTVSNRSTMNRYVDDPFDDPWSGILATLLLITIALCTKHPRNHHTFLNHSW